MGFIVLNVYIFFLSNAKFLETLSILNMSPSHMGNYNYGPCFAIDFSITLENFEG